MEKTSQVYNYIRILIRYAFWLSYKRIVVLGKENIPKDKPIIFTANHQNALMDDLAIVLTNHTQPVWLGRADLFKAKFARPFLKFFRVLPVYRIRDGKENLSKNDEIFERAIRILEHKQVIGLFPEASHSGRRQMLEHKKAAPRIAFLAEEKNNFELGLQIVPIGIYFSHYWKFNRSLIVNYGSPIDVDQYKLLFHENEHKATMALRQEILERIKTLTININSPKYYLEYERMREMAGKQYAGAKKFSKNYFLDRFFSDKELVENLERFESQDQETFTNLLEEVNEYYKLLDESHLLTNNVKPIEATNTFMLFVKMAIGILLSPLFFAGFAANGLLFLLPRLIIEKKVKDFIFRSTFNLVIGLIWFPLTHLILAIIIGSIFHSFLLGLFLFLSLPLFGKATYQLFESYCRTYRCLHYQWLWYTHGLKTKQLLHKKTELVDKIIDAARNYGKTYSN